MFFSRSEWAIIRAPIEALLTFALLTLSSFMLFSSISEYTAMNAQMAEIMDNYKGVGAVEIEPAKQDVSEDFWNSANAIPEQYRVPAYGLDFYLYTDDRVVYNPYENDIEQYKYKSLSLSDIERISKLPYVTGSHIRYMTAGISASFKRIDYRTDHYSYTARFVIEATLDHIDERTSELWFKDINLLAGDERWFDGRTVIKVFARENDEDDFKAGLARIVHSKSDRFITIKHYDDAYSELHYQGFLDRWITGERYYIVGRLEPTLPAASLNLSDPATIDRYPQIVQLADASKYGSMPENRLLRELIDITNDDLHTLDVVYTDNMSSIVRFAEKNMVMTSGRLLTEDDTAGKNNVCVVNNRFMAEYGLKLGDMISLRLGDKLFEQNAALGAVAVTKDRYSDEYTEEIEFEIVGAYADVDTKAQQSKNLHWGYSVNTVFVPTSFLPIEVPSDHQIMPGEFSFVVDDPSDIKGFMETSYPIIENELGLRLLFADGGWSQIDSQMQQVNVSIVARSVVYFLAAVIAVSITAYIIFIMGRKGYALSRALGETRKQLCRSLLKNMIILGLPASLLGSILGHNHSSIILYNAFAAFEQIGFEQVKPVLNRTMPASIMFIIAIFVLSALLCLHRFNRIPLLLQLQGGAQKGFGRYNTARRGVRVHVKATASRSMIPVLTGYSAVANENSTTEHVVVGYSNTNIYHNCRNLHRTTRWLRLRHATRHAVLKIRRSVVKDILIAIFAFLLAYAIGEMLIIIDHNRSIYNNIDQKAYVMDGIDLQGVYNSEDTECIRAVYCENVIRSLKCHREELTVIMTNNIVRYNDGPPEIVFMDGYDYSMIGLADDQLINRECDLCIIDSSLKDALGIEIGDTIRIHNVDVEASLIQDHFGPSPAKDEEEQRLREAYIEPYLDDASVYFRVVGVVVSGGIYNGVFIPLTNAIVPVLKNKESIFDYVEYSLVSPEHSIVFSEFIKKELIGKADNIELSYIIDTSEADKSARMLTLLNTLFPIVFAASIIICVITAGFLAVRSAYEATVMRLLGTTKASVRYAVAIELVLPYLAGILLAVAAIRASNSSVPVEQTGYLCLRALSQFAAFSAGALVVAALHTQSKKLMHLRLGE